MNRSPGYFDYEVLLARTSLLPKDGCMEIKFSLPDILASQAKAAGLLSPQAIENLLRAALGLKAVNEPFEGDVLFRLALTRPVSRCSVCQAFQRSRKTGTA